MNINDSYCAHAVKILERGIIDYGSQFRLALALSSYKYRGQHDCEQQYISKWIKRGYVPAEWVIPLEMAINRRAKRKVTDRKMLLPVVFDDKKRGIHK